MLIAFTPEALAAYDWSAPVGFAGMPFADYQKIHALNGSLAKEALKSATKAAYYLKASKSNPRTQALLFGTAWHCAMLEPHELDNVAVLAQEFDKDGKPKMTFSTRSTGKTAAAWVAANPALVPFDTEDWQTLGNMTHRARNDDFEFGPGWVSECVILWMVDGVPHKARLDGLNLQGVAPVVLEVKTTRSVDPRDFQRQVATLGYHVSAAHYHDAVLALTGQAPAFHFFAQEKTAPFDWLFQQASLSLLASGRKCMQTAREMWQKTNAFQAPAKAQIAYPAEIDLPSWYDDKAPVFCEEE